MYRACKKHLGRTHAKDLHREIKGQQLLSANSFRMAARHRHSCNHEVAKDILHECAELAGTNAIRVFAAAVYGERDILKRVNKERLTRPIANMLRNISCAAAEMGSDRSVTLVFDDQLADRNTSISIRRFVAGINLPNVSHYPLIGVSHVSPGIQLADLGAFIVGRRAVGDMKFNPWVSRLREIEWIGEMNGRKRRGFVRWTSNGDGTVAYRNRWERAQKKEPGATGKVAS